MKGTNLKKCATLILVLLAGFSVMGFGSTKLAFSWRNPSAAGGPFKNILVFALNGQAANRADYEDRLTAAITVSGVQAVQSYSLMPRPNLTPIDMNQLRSVVQGQGFDAVLVSRIVQYHKTVNYVPGQVFPLDPYYATFYGYYAFASPLVYSPGYLQTDTKAQVETNVYSTAKPEGELVWTCTSDTVNPHSVSDAIGAIVKLVAQELQKQNLI
jgi:predicted GNAT family acetyltransferase